MDTLTRADLEALIQKHEGPCVSLYIPTLKGRAAEQNSIRFKNLAKQAEKELAATGVRSLEVKSLLKPAYHLLEDSQFWRYQSEGMAAFLCDGSMRYFRAPVSFDELVVVASRFHIKPLLPLLSGENRFRILAVSQNKVRLLEGTRFRVSEVDLKGVPESLAKVLEYDVPQKELQFFTGTPRHAGRRDAIHYGTGPTDPNIKKAILRYFQQVDKGLREVYKEDQAPLLLAGVNYLFPIYREASAYAHIVDEGIDGNPDEISAEELHRRAWKIVEPHFRKSLVDSAGKFDELMGSGSPLASHKLRDIIEAAYHSRIKFMFVALGVQQWGLFDPDSGTVHEHATPEPGDQDLLDVAAIYTLSNGGTVFAVKSEDVPGSTEVAAVFRY